jgi:hypothetical protein
MARILVVGVYMADRPNTAAHVIYELASSTQHEVEQRWLAIAPGGRGRFDLPTTQGVVTQPTPKFELLNRLTGDFPEFDWIVLCDDDVEFGAGFLDRFIAAAKACDFALSQPGRTADSYFDHPIVLASPGLVARRTRFVEIGPVVVIRSDAAQHLLPFQEEDGMGWGLDLIWPVVMERAGLRMGIIDCVQVAHRMRPQVKGYDGSKAHRSAALLLARRDHLTPDEAFRVLEAFPCL